MDLPRPEIIVTHESDLDGLVAGLLLQRLATTLFDAEIPLEAYPNHAWRQRPLREPSAWVCDFSFEPRVDRTNWLVIDHHHTEFSPRRARLIHDPAKSAGRLCYELCREAGLASRALDRLIRLNDVADLFLLDDPDFQTAADYANLVKTYQFWNLHALIEGRLENLLDHPLLEVMEVKRRIEDPLGLAWSRANIVELSPTVGYVDTVLGNINLIVHELLKEESVPYPVLLTLLRKGNGAVIASLRSREGQALRVAERLQGGGHPNAAGATLPRAIQRIPDAIDYLKRVLNPPQAEVGVDSLESAFAVLNQRAAGSQ
jgi:hypothetical protein